MRVRWFVWVAAVYTTPRRRSSLAHVLNVCHAQVCILVRSEVLPMLLVYGSCLASTCAQSGASRLVQTLLLASLAAFGSQLVRLAN